MNSETQERRWSWSAANAVAAELAAALAPVAVRVQIAGSLRRKKKTVGDVELLFIPRFDERQLDMFSTAPCNLAEERIGQLMSAGVLAKRLNKDGRCAFGAKNKLMVHCTSGIPVDLFTATEANWANYLVCRTGPAELNTAIAMRARARGWQWNPYGPGFTELGTGRVHPVQAEAEVFEFVGLSFPQPEERR